MGAKDGPRNVTIKDIAARLGLTHATISRALNDHAHTSEKTKVRVRAEAAALGYVPHLPARLMRQQSSTLIGLLLPDIENPFYATIARAMAAALTETGMQLMLAVTNDDPVTEHKQVLALRGARVAGLAVTLTAAPLPETLMLLDGVPAVQMIRRVRGGPKAAVVMDDRGGVRDATAHLLALGHRRIAYVGTPLDVSTGKDRMRGFEEAHEMRGLALRERLIKIGPPHPAFGREALAQLLSARQPPTAVMLGGPQLTLGAMETIHRLGWGIPADLSVISFGDAEWFLASNPAISAVRAPIEETVRTAAQILLRHLTAKDGSQRSSFLKTHRVSRPVLTPRGTTGKPSRS
jgi:LacI family transcriptional regulator